jgi:hypothetical protein
LLWNLRKAFQISTIHGPQHNERPRLPCKQLQPRT